MLLWCGAQNPGKFPYCGAQNQATLSIYTQITPRLLPLPGAHDTRRRKQSTNACTTTTLFMSTDDRIRKKIRLPLLITGVIMTLFYLGVGSYILLNPGFLPKIPEQFRSVFGGLLIVYGLYRGWRLYADHA